MTQGATIRYLAACTTLCAAVFSTSAFADPAIETETARPLKAGVWAVGSAAEVQTADEGREYALPFTFEYGLRDDLEILIEPVPYTQISPKRGKKARGPGDLEVTLTYLAFAETDVLPAIAIAGEVKLPTARNDLIGSGKTDATLYLIASKRFVDVDVHANAGYTFVGEPKGLKLDNTFNFALAAEYRINDMYNIFAEALYTSSSIPEGGAEGSDGVVAAGAATLPSEAASEETIGTLGARYRLTPDTELSGSWSYDNNSASLFRLGLQFKF